ncbi:MAG: IS5 family transposase, partial [Muribaculaceae bacterium]
CDCGEKRKSPKICDRAAHFLLKIVILEKEIAMKKNLLTSAQKLWLKKYFKNNNIHLKISNLEGLVYLLKTGCQWRLLPKYYGAWQTVYYYFRTLGDKDAFSKIKRKLLENKRIKSGKRKSPSVAVIDSQSVRSGLSKSEKGIDGNKKIKGIKRHISVDSAGNPLEIIITRANIHDSKVSAALISKSKINYPNIEIVKAENGYKSNINSLIKDLLSIEVQCVKSNFGTSEFIPIQGRCAVERI